MDFLDTAPDDLNDEFSGTLDIKVISDNQVVTANGEEVERLTAEAKTKEKQLLLLS